MRQRDSIRRRVGLVVIITGVTLVMALVMGVAAFVIHRQQLEIENKAKRIFDIAFPMVATATVTIRDVEWLSRDGESILWIDDITERTARRQQLNSILEDEGLQRDEAKRALVANSFAVLDLNLSDMERFGAAARSRALERWRAIKFSLRAQSDQISAEASTSASDEADSMVETAQFANRVVTITNAAVATVAAALGFFLYFAFIRPLMRLSRSLKLVQEGQAFTVNGSFIQELQILNDGAANLARAHHELETARGELEKLAHSDPLTGLANRRMFELRGNEEFDRGRRYSEEFSVVVFDIDHFKAINDRFSHEGGDIVLRSLGKLLLDTRRSSDLPVARVGGEEFSMILPHATLEMARGAAERIRKGIAGLKVVMPGDETFEFTASFGVATRRPEDTDLQSLLHRADVALYEAKNGGRNRVALAQ